MSMGVKLLLHNLVYDEATWCRIFVLNKTRVIGVALGLEASTSLLFTGANYPAFSINQSIKKLR